MRVPFRPCGSRSVATKGRARKTDPGPGGRFTAQYRLSFGALYAARRACARGCTGRLAQGAAQGLASGVGARRKERNPGCEGARARGESGSPGARAAHRAHDLGRTGKSSRAAGIEPRTRNALLMAAQPLAVQVGVAPACQALGVSRATFYRRQRLPGTSSPVQRGRVRARARPRCSPAHASSPWPAEVVATLLALVLGANDVSDTGRESAVRERST